MAFTAPQSSSNNAPSNDRFEKAAGFINIRVPSANGKSLKVGAIALKRSDKVHAKLLEKLMVDPEAMGRLLAILEFDFQPAEKDVGDITF